MNKKISILGLFISIIILAVGIYLNKPGSSSALILLCGGILFLGSLVYIFISHRMTADEAIKYYAQKAALAALANARLLQSSADAQKALSESNPSDNTAHQKAKSAQRSADVAKIHAAETAAQAASL